MKLKPIKWYCSLQSKKGRKKEAAFLVEGERAISQLYNNKSEAIVELLVLEGYETPYSDVESRIVSDKQMRQILSTETVVPLVAVVSSEEILKQQLPNSIEGRLLFLEDVQDPGNVGTLIRSAVAFGFSTILLSAGCADPLSPKVVRSTGGAICEVSIIRLSDAYDALEKLKEAGYTLITADLNGENTPPLQNTNIIFALGNEGNGVSEKLRSLSDMVYTIPFRSEKIESLNVAVAGSIGMAALYSGE